ncbi:hypothetical protein BDF14DRAFT_346177 [Spinellus fusiger]|nr:hypothetical protein BDF14DRAFT_346177 [Spinellus fusiger]
MLRDYWLILIVNCQTIGCKLPIVMWSPLCLFLTLNHGLLWLWMCLALRFFSLFLFSVRITEDRATMEEQPMHTRQRRPRDSKAKEKEEYKKSCCTDRKEVKGGQKACRPRTSVVE